MTSSDLDGVGKGVSSPLIRKAEEAIRTNMNEKERTIDLMDTIQYIINNQ